VPANTTATLSIPTNNVNTIKESGQSIHKVKGVKFIELKDGKAVPVCSSITRVGKGIPF